MISLQAKDLADRWNLLRNVWNNKEVFLAAVGIHLHHDLKAAHHRIWRLQQLLNVRKEMLILLDQV